MGNSNSEHLPVVSKAEVYRFYGSKFLFKKNVLPKLIKHGIDCTPYFGVSKILPREFVLQLFHVEQITVDEWIESITIRK